MRKSRLIDSGKSVLPAKGAVPERKSRKILERVISRLAADNPTGDTPAHTNHAEHESHQDFDAHVSS